MEFIKGAIAILFVSVLFLALIGGTILIANRIGGFISCEEKETVYYYDMPNRGIARAGTDLKIAKEIANGRNIVVFEDCK